MVKWQFVFKTLSFENGLSYQALLGLVWKIFWHSLLICFHCFIGCWSLAAIIMVRCPYIYFLDSSRSISHLVHPNGKIHGYRVNNNPTKCGWIWPAAGRNLPRGLTFNNDKCDNWQVKRWLQKKAVKTMESLKNKYACP